MSNSTKNNKKQGRLQKAVLTRTVIPMIIMGIVIGLVAFYGYKNSIRKEVENSLSAVAASAAGAYDEMYPGDYKMVGDKIISIYKGDTDITGIYNMIDRIKKDTGMDVTLFYQNTRILTTLQDTYGGRYIQTGINAGLYNNISSSTEVLCYQVNIDGESYYAAYLPLYTKDETFVGIMATAIKEKEIDQAAVEASIPILAIILVATVFSGFISYTYTNQLVDAISKISKFLNGMTGGKLDNDMPKTVLKREDELGDAGKSVVDMQNAIRVLVERDPLTGLYNRRYGGAKLRNIQKHANKCGLPYAVCICDIDFFKKVNDTYGHDAGDVVLKKVAEIMKKSMSGKGFCARWGGEEFLLIFDKVGIKGATKELNKILDTIRATEIIYDELKIRITMSFGVVDGDQSDDYGALLRHADERLYSGKMNGRNQVVCNDDLIEQAENNAKESAGNKDNKENVKETTKENTKENADNKSEQTAQSTTDIKQENNQEIKENQDDNSNDEKHKESKEDDNNTSKSKKIKLDYDGNKDEEFLSKLVQKMNEQLYIKTMEEEEEQEDDED